MTPMQRLLEQHLGHDSLAPVTRKLGIELVAWSSGEATVAIDVDVSLHNALGTLHGGIYCDLADVAFGCALASTIAADERFTTSQLSATFLRSVREGRLHARAQVIQRGRRSAYLECDVLDAAGELVARLTSHCLLESRTPPEA